MPRISKRAQAPSSSDTLDVRPGTGIFRILKNLSYKVQYAFAEYIDNSISSYEQNRKALHNTDPDYKLRVDIEIGEGKITVRDNAAGIARGDYPRAFRPAEAPADPSKGLNEFGMGMKTASIWLSSNWKVVTDPLGDSHTGTVVFDIPKIIKSGEARLAPRFTPKQDQRIHGTTIVLENLNHRITNLPAIRDHLAEIYRCYLRKGEVDIRVYRTEEDADHEDSILKHVEFRPLVAPAAYPKGPSTSVRWEKDISIKLPGGQKVTGKAMVLERGNTKKAGLYLFRRNRLIIGAAEPYRPEMIFGRSNSFESQRIYGELHLDGFEVTHTKDAIIWGAKGDDEETFVEKVNEALTEGKLDLILQANTYRAPKLENDDGLAKAANKTHNKLEEEIKSKTKEMEPVATVPVVPPEPQKAEEPPAPLVAPVEISTKMFETTIAGDLWAFEIKVDKRKSKDPLFVTTVKREPLKKGEMRITCSITINANNSLAASYLSRDEDYYEVFVRIAVAMTVAKARCEEQGLRYANAFLRYTNEHLNILDGTIRK